MYRGLIPEETTPVIGVTPAVIGCIQATEVIKYIVGIGRLLTNKLLVYDGLNMKFTELVVHASKRVSKELDNDISKALESLKPEVSSRSERISETERTYHIFARGFYFIFFVFPKALS
jgi:hypothetical protein